MLITCQSSYSPNPAYMQWTIPGPAGSCRTHIRTRDHLYGVDHSSASWQVTFCAAL